MLLSFYYDFSCSEIPDSFCFMYFEYFLVTASFALTSFLLLCADSMLPVTALALTNFLRYEAHSSSSSQAYFESRIFFLLQTVGIFFFLLLTFWQIQYQCFLNLHGCVGFFGLGTYWVVGRGVIFLFPSIKLGRNVLMLK